MSCYALPGVSHLSASRHLRHSKFTCLLQMLADIRPNEEHAKEHIERNPVTTVAQVVPEMSEHEVGSCCLKISLSAFLR